MLSTKENVVVGETNLNVLLTSMEPILLPEEFGSEKNQADR
jgi:hypothetical protein